MIEEKLREIYNRDGWTCQRCEGKATEIAHRIAKTKANRKMIKAYAKKWYDLDLSNKDIDKIIHHEKNLVATCKICNDYFNIGFKKKIVEKLLDDIISQEF